MASAAATASAGVRKAADRLDDGAAVARGDLAQPLEMLLHQGEGVEVADPIIELGGALEVGE
jgi:hypothetical protein